MNYQTCNNYNDSMSTPAKWFIPSFIFFYFQAIHSSIKQGPNSLHCGFFFFLILNMGKIFIFFLIPYLKTQMSYQL